jgi:hypothetical protein
LFDFARRLFRRQDEDSVKGLSFDRPLVLLQSNDWGRVGVRDQEGFDILRAKGFRLGQRPYDFYSLEKADDLEKLQSLLKRHRDSTGRSACMVMNFVMANLDFSRMARAAYQRVIFRPLSDGLPGNWKRPGLFESYRAGIAEGLFYPALHGRGHFCTSSVEYALAHKRDRREMLQLMWRAETPCIFWRMPWIGYEFFRVERPQVGFLTAESQEALIESAVSNFTKFFATPPLSTCAPGYKANVDTRRAWAKQGIRVVQNGSGAALPPYMDEYEMLNLHHTIDFEPTQQELSLEKYLQLAANCFDRGVPAIISMHSINFHSSLRDFLNPTLAALDNLLTALEAKYPNLLYVNDDDVYKIVTRGKFKTTHGAVSVGVRQGGATKLRALARGAH